MQLAHDYCEEMTGTVCLDAIRLELLHESNEMRKRAYLLPRDSMVHKIPLALNGEHQFAMYREEDLEQKILFYDQEEKKINSYWAIPSFSEILAIEPQTTEFAALNHANLYKFELGDPEKKDEYGRPMPSEFAVNNQRALLDSRLPKLTMIDIASAESQLVNHQRVVEFQ